VKPKLESGLCPTSACSMASSVSIGEKKRSDFFFEIEAVARPYVSHVRSSTGVEERSLLLES